MNNKWLDFVRNPEAITSLYKSPPFLNKVRISRATIDNPHFEIRLLVGPLPYPDKPPKRWSTGDNCVYLEMTFSGSVDIFWHSLRSTEQFFEIDFFRENDMIVSTWNSEFTKIIIKSSSIFIEKLFPSLEHG